MVSPRDSETEPVVDHSSCLLLLLEQKTLHPVRCVWRVQEQREQVVSLKLNRETQETEGSVFMDSIIESQNVHIHG